MADDTRQDGQSPKTNPEDPYYQAPRRPKPKHEFPKTQAGKLWDALGNPEEPANSIPGGTYNSAGGKPKEITWRDAFRFDVFNNENKPSFYQTSCGRDSLLVGMGAGGAVGGLRFILSGLSSMLVTSNYAVGAFALSASAQYYWCTQRQREENKGMAQAVRGMQMLNEKAARERAQKQAAEADRLKAEEEQRQNRSWYKFW